MAENLSKRLRQARFSSVFQQAVLSILVASEDINRHHDEVCEQFGVTLQQYNVLRILRGVYPEGHPRCEITDRMIQRAPDVTRLINRLVDQGLAVRGKSESDARLSLTFITPKGMELLTTIEPELLKVERQVASKLTKEQAKQLTDLCDLLINTEQQATR